MEKVLTPVLNKTCTGCGACLNACPKNAISMQWDEYGFYKPVIDKEKCVNCGLCEKVCPIDKFNSYNDPEPKVFALQINDEEQLYKSASGGAFAVLAQKIIKQGGVVYGVIYDDEMNVRHSRSETIDGLEKMYSSKYVQSNTKNTFKQAKEDLENGKTVLFSGTPCQIAGLKSYLRKDYENLLTVDLVCHGVPSPKVFDIYKKEFMQKRPKDEWLININFRSKIQGWSNEVVGITTATTLYTILAINDNFMKTFLSDLSTNSACHNCQFNKLPRVADLSVGDFWGVDDYDKTLNNNKGLSIVLVNSEKGREWFEKIKDNCMTKEVPLDAVMKYNPNIKDSSKPHKKRLEFFEDINSGKSLKSCVKKYCKTPLHIVIYRLLPEFAKDFIKYKVLKMERKS